MWPEVLRPDTAGLYHLVDTSTKADSTNQLSTENKSVTQLLINKNKTPVEINEIY